MNYEHLISLVTKIPRSYSRRSIIETFPSQPKSLIYREFSIIERMPFLPIEEYQDNIILGYTED